MMHLFRKRNSRGFTLIELLIVMSIVGILATISAPSYQRSVIQAREAVLMEDLSQMRRAIDAFFVDRAAYPDRLDDLVEYRYLRSLPRDPFTRSAETWWTVPPDPGPDGEMASGGIFDVFSGSDLIGLNGIPYHEW